MSATRGRLFSFLAITIAVAAAYAIGLAQGGRGAITPANALKWEPYAPGAKLQVATLWGDRTKAGDYGMLLKMPPGFEAGRHSHTNDYHGVAIQGTWVHTTDADKTPRDLLPGSYAMQPGKQIHNDVCKGATECIILIHQQGPGDFIPAKLP